MSLLTKGEEAAVAGIGGQVSEGGSGAAWECRGCQFCGRLHGGAVCGRAAVAEQEAHRRKGSGVSGGMEGWTEEEERRMTI